MAYNSAQYIWSDRKRFLGMPLSFTRYALSDDRLFFSVGFFSIKDEEVILYRVRDISVRRTLWQRLFGVGTILIVSSDKTTPLLTLKNIKRPMDVKEILHDSVEEMKLRRKYRVSEIQTDADPNDSPDEHDAMDDEWSQDFDFDDEDE